MRTKSKLFNNIAEDNIDSLYVQLCNLIYKNGKVVISRGMEVKELIGVNLILTNPKRRFLENANRKLKLYYAIGEFIWYMRGSNSLEEIQYYAPSMSQFSDDGSTLQGAYGPKIVTQIDKLITLLRHDKGTRMAVLPIYSASELGKDSKDIPCTLTLEFLIRANKLHLIVNMRSNDIFLGLPYDIFSFTMIQEYIANKIGLNLGYYYHNIGSLHVYKKHFDRIKEISTMNIHKTSEFNNSNLIFKNLSDLLNIEKSIRNGSPYNMSKELLNNSDFNRIKIELEKYKDSR